MNKIIMLISLTLISTAAMSQGKALHDSACLQCHASLMQGEPLAIYGQEGSKMTSLAKLEKQVAGCSVAADVTWSKQQQKQVVDYLANRFYNF